MYHRPGLLSLHQYPQPCRQPDPQTCVHGVTMHRVLKMAAPDPIACENATLNRSAIRGELVWQQWQTKSLVTGVRSKYSVHKLNIPL